MKRIVFFLLLISFSLLSITGVCQQSNDVTTVIIVRHGEKQAGNDPALTSEGMQRAERLSAVFKGVKPDEIFSSPYIRTRQTINPWAKEAGVEIQEYDPRNLEKMATYLLSQVNKTIVVAGHSNTNPRLVNLLLQQEKYKDLDDSEYSTIYVITIKDKKATDKIVTY
ncbi:SixA phosphatase family protein [Aridibaculum aurantiacum]|uniref:SixA phosphatase family protein n=1 Tax=Aridibaculum aurantiacum TaxID=2810307 RepID=UPI001A97CE02|nr:phosphoglycerate mutase family protein [Aridibaculum aurantiacum]